MAATSPAVRTDLPSGTVTFVFTDIEGSTKLAHDLGLERWGEILAQHAAVVRPAVAAHEGVIVRTEGDSFFLAFRSARQAVGAAADIERGFAATTWAYGQHVRVRIGMHTGENARPGTAADASDYVGFDVHQAARVASAANGGQVLISSATRTLLGDQVPAGVTLRDLGEHRLKDVPTPDRLYQLVIEGLPSDFPEIHTLERAPNNLPLQLTTFVGRKAELAEARSLLGATRLLTLLGPGGTGKTRLSIELAAQVMAEFADGVWFIRLASVTDPALVVPTIAHTMEIAIAPGGSALPAVIEHLKSRRVLLVLDNFEQVVDAASDVGELLVSTNAAKIVVSSRSVLRLTGEQVYSVPPLALPSVDAVPDVERLRSAESIQLFLERARAAKNDFMLTVQNARAVVGIVAQLDGLPLAIELAAARVKVLPPQAILERLASGIGVLQSSARDLPARQRTLEGAISWSYDLLDAGLQKLLRRFSVFRGGAALEQIEAVCGPADEIGRDVLDGVAELVDQSLARQTGGEVPRFVMHETIRQFAHDKLVAESELGEIELRHARAYLTFAEEIAPRLLGSEQKALLDRLETEMGNLRAALDICSRTECAADSACTCAPGEHAADDARVEMSLRLTKALWRFWQMRGHLVEGRQRTDRILALPRAEQHRAAYLGALEAAGGVTYWLGDMAATEATYEKRLTVARETGDRHEIADALYDLSFIYVLPDREPDKARAMLDEAISDYRAVGDRAGVAKALWASANSDFNTSEFTKAVKSLEEVVATFRELDNRFGLGWASHSLGVGHIRLGRPEDARSAFTEGLELFRDAGDVTGIVIFLYDFAELAAAQRRDDRAVRLFGAGTELKNKTMTQLADYLREENRPFAIEVIALIERVDPKRFAELAAEGAALSREDAIAFALSDVERPG